MTATEWFMKAEIEKLEKENKELKEKLALTENDRDERRLKYKDQQLIVKDSEKQMKLYMQDRDMYRDKCKKLENELAEQMDGWNGLRDEIEYRYVAK